jgi:hypothetical protein
MGLVGISGARFLPEPTMTWVFYFRLALPAAILSAAVFTARAETPSVAPSPAFGLGNARDVRRPRDEKAIRRLVEVWNSAFETNDIRAVAETFDYTAGIADAEGVPACCGAPAVEAALRRDLLVFYPDRTHTFQVSDIWFVWKATVVYFTMPLYYSDIAVARITHESRSTTETGLPPESSEITAVARKVSGRWLWHSAWPFMPVADRAVEPEHLDGTVWFVPEVPGVNEDREAELILFAGGRFVSGTSMAKTMGRQGLPPVYDAERRKDLIIWTGEEDSFKDVFRRWFLEVDGPTMRGRDRLVSPLDGLEDVWTWTAVRLQ